MNYDFFEPLPKIIPVGKTIEFVLRGRVFLASTSLF